MEPALALAERALADHDDRAALGHLLHAWRATRATAIAELVELVSARLEATLPPIASRSRRQLHEQWLALAAAQDPADLPRLLDTITDTRHRATDALARVRALAHWPADPRTGPGVLRQLQRPAFYTTTTKPFWSALLALAVEHGDPRTAAALAQLSAEFHRILVTRYADATPTVKWFRKLFDQTLAELAAQPPPPPLAAADAAACTRMMQRSRERPRTERDLFAEVIAAPDDDSLRHVLADQLQERGDPRGEFIALQLAHRDRERQRALLAQFRHRWLGPLAHAVRRDTCRFERGFLHEVYLVEDKPELLARLVGDPIWATVRRLHLVPPLQPPLELLRHPIMQLDHLGGFGFYPDEEPPAVFEWPEVPYRSLHLSTGVHVYQYTDAIAYLASADVRDKLRRLRSLTLTDPFVEPDEALTQLRGTWLGDQLDELGFAGGLARLPQWLWALRRRPLAIRTFTLSSFGEQIGTLVLSRDPHGGFSRAMFTVEHVTDPRARDWVLAYSDIVEALEHVPPTQLQAIEVRGRPPRHTERAELERVCKRIGAALVLPV
ncbi:MAG TPA: TIGR02996 domain-containing protein [Kofleriaceae bacterium]|nr:TIGR02996 domain-containing protein [Kofleriaceae bacterium]